MEKFKHGDQLYPVNARQRVKCVQELDEEIRKEEFKVAREARQQKTKRKRRKLATPPENKDAETAVEFWKRKQQAPMLPKLNDYYRLNGLKFIPWGGRDSSTGTVLSNTCPVDNALMCLQALYKFNSQVKAYFDDGPHEVARHVRQALELIENEQFSAAKIYWWEKVAKQIFRTDMKGNELDLGKTPLDPLFARFQDFFYCEEHGYFASLPCNPCERILGNIENYVSEATSTETELSCLADVNCCGHTYKAMHPPEDSHHPHFLVYSGMRLLGIRPNTLGDIPAEICIAGETYNLLAVTLHKPGLGKKSLGHYVTAICRGNCEWVCYDALKI